MLPITNACPQLVEAIHDGRRHAPRIQGITPRRDFDAIEDAVAITVGIHRVGAIQ
jgi:hypothetical protein